MYCMSPKKREACLVFNLSFYKQYYSHVINLGTTSMLYDGN